MKDISHHYDLTKKQLLQVYRNMALSRRCDQKMMILLKQGKAFFHMSAAGHEAAQTAAAMNFTPGKDWAFPYYRSQAFVMQWGMTLEEIFLDFLSKADGPCSAGRQMPHHYGHVKLRIPTQSSPTGTQILQAVGAAHASKLGKFGEAIYLSLGEGTTSQGDFHEGMNWASREKLPLIIHIENNHFAISVPVEQQMMGGSINDLVAGYTGVKRVAIDGTDFFQSYQAFNDAVKRARSNEGATVIISDLVRLMPHSSSDDHLKYRTKEELERDKVRDPIRKFQELCLTKSWLTEKEFKDIDGDIAASVEKVS